MRLRRLTLEHFRTYEQAQVDFTQAEFGSDRDSAAQISIVSGQNAAGKSNLLEAIALLSTTHAVHARTDAQAIRAGATVARVAAQFDTAGRTKELMCILDTTTGRTKKLWRLQGAPKTSRAVVGLLTTLLFKPEDVDVLQKTSAARRAVIDQLITIRSSELYSTLQRLRTTLSQRQTLLEQVRAGESGSPDLYDEQLIQDSARISAARTRVVEWLRPHFSSYMATLGQTTTPVELTLTTPLADPASRPSTESDWSALYRSSIEQLREREIAAARNLVSPQREDLSIVQTNLSLREYGSRGEWRSVVISLLLASADYIEHLTKERPVLLLDDIFSELDENRRRALLPHLSRQQTIITTADLNEVPPQITERARLLRIQAGKILPTKASTTKITKAHATVG